MIGVFSREGLWAADRQHDDLQPVHFDVIIMNRRSSEGPERFYPKAARSESLEQYVDG